jgi:hypothetical protein
MLDPVALVWIVFVVAPLCALFSVAVVIKVIREEMRGGGDDEETQEAPLRDAVPRDGEAGLPDPFRRPGGPAVVPSPQRGEDLRVERVPVFTLHVLAYRTQQQQVST